VSAASLTFFAAGNGNVHIWGTSPESIDIAEDRDRWMELLSKLNIRQPAGGSARSEVQALAKVREEMLKCGKAGRGWGAAG
jgi:carbamoylphosphate synthase large subunit